MSTSLAVRGLAKQGATTARPDRTSFEYYKPSYLDHYLGEKMERVNQWRRNVDIKDKFGTLMVVLIKVLPETP